MIVLVETTVPMYLIGGPHVNKGRAETALREAVQRGDRLATDAEVLQEICHRYTAIRRGCGSSRGAHSSHAAVGMRLSA